MKDIAIYGAGGFGKEVACLLSLINQSDGGDRWNFLGFFDDSLEAGTHTSYGDILGDMETLNSWERPIGVAICIAGKNTTRKIVEKINNPLVYYPNIIAPDTIFLDKNSFNIGQGNVICSRCLISLCVTMGDFNIFNGHIAIGHDTSIGSNNVFMPGVKISGNVIIGDNNFAGLDAAFIQNVKVGSNVTIGAKSFVIRNALSNNNYMGIPATKFNV